MGEEEGAEPELRTLRVKKDSRNHGKRNAERRYESRVFVHQHFLRFRLDVNAAFGVVHFDNGANGVFYFLVCFVFSHLFSP